MDNRVQDDKTLIRLITQSRAPALGELYDRHGRLVFSVALHIVRDPQTAEEITLDVFTHVWQKAHTYQPDKAKVSTWLVSIARHQAIDVLRRQASRPERNLISWEAAASASQAATNPVEDTPEEVTALVMRQERVRAAVAQLPVEQQHALELAYFKGQTHRQIATALDLPLGTVKTRIRLAMQKLRLLLDDE